MSRQVEIHEARTNFAKLAEAVEAGEEVIIVRAGKPLMRLVKFDGAQKDTQPGFAKDQLADWDEVTWGKLDREFNELFKG